MAATRETGSVPRSTSSISRGSPSSGAHRTASARTLRLPVLLSGCGTSVRQEVMPPMPPRMMAMIVALTAIACGAPPRPTPRALPPI
ncbi:hypothetical protein NMG29_30925 [Streptomyces cocklensis]|nr:hypothetical protein [Actinacidiphila cocklensis]